MHDSQRANDAQTSRDRTEDIRRVAAVFMATNESAHPDPWVEQELAGMSEESFWLFMDAFNALLGGEVTGWTELIIALKTLDNPQITRPDKAESRLRSIRRRLVRRAVLHDG